MKAFAGIGLRNISKEEETKIIKFSDFLCRRGYIVYSGNAEGSDISFQIGSGGNCVIFLPWNRFNLEKFNYIRPENCLNYFVVGNSEEGMNSIKKYHPNPSSLSRGATSLMSRNYYQVMGYKQFPQVDFVVCCADEDKNGNVLGGTGQACRIAKDLNIPVINIRNENWKILLRNELEK